MLENDIDNAPEFLIIHDLTYLVYIWIICRLLKFETLPGKQLK